MLVPYQRPPPFPVINTSCSTLTGRKSPSAQSILAEGQPMPGQSTDFEKTFFTIEFRPAFQRNIRIPPAGSVLEV